MKTRVLTSSGSPKTSPLTRDIDDALGLAPGLEALWTCAYNRGRQGDGADLDLPGSEGRMVSHLKFNFAWDVAAHRHLAFS